MAVLGSCLVISAVQGFLAVVLALLSFRTMGKAARATPQLCSLFKLRTMKAAA